MTVPATQDAPTNPSTVVQAQAMWQSSLVTEMLHVAADHGVFALLLDGPSTSSVLADTTGVHERSLHRLLRAMVGLGICASSPQGWTLTPLGTAAAKLAGPSEWALPTIPQLGRAVETGRPAMTFSHGSTIFEYFAAHPDDGAEFDARLAVINAAESRAVTEAYAFAGVNRLVDVGGGNGDFWLRCCATTQSSTASSSTFHARSRTHRPSWRSSRAAARSRRATSSRPCPRTATPTCSRTSSTTGRSHRPSRSSLVYARRSRPPGACFSSRWSCHPWAAWPFHRVTLRNARHGTASMEALISVGVTAATLWSLYTIFFGHHTRTTYGIGRRCWAATRSTSKSPQASRC